MTTETHHATPAAVGSPALSEGLGPALEDAAHDCLSALAGVDTYDVNLRDSPQAWAAIDAFAAKVRAAERERICVAIKAEDDHCADRDYMLTSDDCIEVARGQWERWA